jgi:hypothetical protein
LAEEKLCRLYGEFVILSESHSKVEKDFGALAHDNRLLNLQFSTPISD